MVLWPDAGLDEITDEFLALMLGEQKFVDQWTCNVERELILTEESKKVAVSGVTAEPEDTRKCNDALATLFEELIHAVDASSQSFLSSVDFTICHCEPEHNRDASLLFAARLQIDRISLRRVDRSRYEAAARRLLQLVRLFTTRISSAFQISNTSAFATSLCDMLYTFCDGVLSSLSERDKEIVSLLRRAVDDFNEIVVEKLSKVAFESQCARRKLATPPRQQFFSPQPVKLRRPLVQIQHRSPGYLLPAELSKKRQKFARSRSQPSVMSAVAIAATRRIPPKSNSYAVSLAARGVKPTQSHAAVTDHMSQRRVEKPADFPDEATVRLARKISSEVMKDLRKKYGKVDIGILGI